jgi:hypothetical protein
LLCKSPHLPLCRVSDGSWKFTTKIDSNKSVGGGNADPFKKEFHLGGKGEMRENANREHTVRPVRLPAFLIEL